MSHERGGNSRDEVHAGNLGKIYYHQIVFIKTMWPICGSNQGFFFLKSIVEQVIPIPIRQTIYQWTGETPGKAPMSKYFTKFMDLKPNHSR